MDTKDAAYEARVRKSFDRQSHMAMLGATIVFIAPGEVHLALPFTPRFCQQNGHLHAGAIASIADSANGYAAYSLAPPETDVLTVEFKINLLAPAQADRHHALDHHRASDGERRRGRGLRRLLFP